MTSRATHIPEPGDGTPVDALGPSLCGRSAVVRVPDPSGATCKVCHKLQKERAHWRIDAHVSVEEAVHSLAHLFSLRQSLQDYPHPSRELLQSMRCVDRRARPRCTCPVCRTDQHNQPIRDELEGIDAERPHRQHAHEFGSVRAALELLVVWRQTGAAIRSQAGSIESRGKELAKLGATVQTTFRHRDSLDTRRATQAADVERACLRAYAEPQSRRGLETPAQCVEVLLDSVDDKAGHPPEWWAEQTGLTVRAVKALIRHGIKRAKVELAACGYVPRPRSRDGLDDAIDQRIAEIEGAA